MSKMQNIVQLCKVPDTVKFQFQEEQEMHSSVTIHNLRDNIVTYKIKTNKPGLYLVKPMEGQILNNNSVTINFKRKQLTLENFNMIQANPGQNREKFLMQLSCDVEDSVGIIQKLQQIAYLGVSFSKVEGTPQPKQKVNWDEGKVRKDKLEKGKNLAATIEQKRKQLDELISKRQILQAKTAGTAGLNSFSQFTLVDLINVTTIAFLMGFAII